MIKKRINLLVFSLLIFLSFNVVAYALGHSWPGDESAGETKVEYSMGSEDGYEYICSYKYKIKIRDYTTLNIYDKENSEINTSSLSPTVNVLAGTSVGVYIHETKTISWEEPQVTVKKTPPPTYYCGGTYTGKEQNCTVDKNCNDGILNRGNLLNFITPRKSLYRIGGECIVCIGIKKCSDFGLSVCDSKPGCSKKKVEGDATTTTDDPWFSTCKEAADEAAKKSAKRNMGASYSLILQNANDIKSSTGLVTISGTGGCSGENPINCSYNYEPSKVCMNPKTANVTYKTGSGASCGSDDFTIPNDGSPSHWHYFVPLNAKSTDTFVLTLGANGNSANKTVNQCTTFIDLYDDYRDWMVRKNGAILTGDSKGDDKNTVKADGGCKAASNVRIGVDQKFYHEEGNKTKIIEGYELFYRPIDISNPFPNGLSSDSYWKGLISGTKIQTTNASGVTKKYDLRDSFKEITYSIYNIPANDIRRYNRNNYYTSWQGMSNDGTSRFVSSYNMRKGKADYYKLGCGPANSDWRECK